MPIYMVEREFSPEMTDADFAKGGEVLAPCIKERDITWVASHLSADGRRSVCVFEAADAERIRVANRTAGLPFTAVWPAKLFRAG